MLKILSLVENAGEKLPINPYEKKLLKIIHEKVWEKHAKDDRIRYNVVEELRNLDETFLTRIYDFLKNIMGFDDP